MKNLVFDIGNTHLVVGFYDGMNLLDSWRISSDQNKTEDEYFGIIRTLILFKNKEIPKIDTICISSVVPELTRIISHLATKYFHKEAIVVTAYLELGLSFPMEDPGFIGSDLIVNAYAAKEKYKQNCIVCDFGTATTVQLIGADGFFYGTSIIPGVMTAASSLFSKASKLSGIQLTEPKKLLGTNTTDALVSGIVYGNAFLIDEFIRRIRKEYQHLNPIKAIATGGIAGLIEKSSNEIEIIDKNLLLDGLNEISHNIQ